jgi:hypothetical protein
MISWSEKNKNLNHNFSRTKYSGKYVELRRLKEGHCLMYKEDRDLYMSPSIVKVVKSKKLREFDIQIGWGDKMCTQKCIREISGKARRLKGNINIHVRLDAVRRFSGSKRKKRQM